MIILSFIFGVIITFFALGLVTHCKDNEPKNNVHFYVARDKDERLWLYIGKPFRGDSDFYPNSDKRVFVLSQNLRRYGLKYEDYDYLKWEDERIEVFLNLED